MDSSASPWEAGRTTRRRLVRSDSSQHYPFNWLPRGIRARGVFHAVSKQKLVWRDGLDDFLALRPSVITFKGEDVFASLGVPGWVQPVSITHRNSLRITCSKSPKIHCVGFGEDPEVPRGAAANQLISELSWTLGC